MSDLFVFFLPPRQNQRGVGLLVCSDRLSVFWLVGEISFDF